MSFLVHLVSCPFTTIGFGRELDLSPCPYHSREARGVSVAMRRAGLLRVARFARRLERQSLQDTFRIRNLTVWQYVSSLVGTTRCSSNPCKNFELTRQTLDIQVGPWIAELKLVFRSKSRYTGDLMKITSDTPSGCSLSGQP
ncbi:unnamed protein product [Musa acuminata subsp. burmannicoides]